MIKKIKLIGIIALAAVIVLTCGSPDDGGGDSSGRNSGVTGTSYTLTFNGNGNTGGAARQKLQENRGT